MCEEQEQLIEEVDIDFEKPPKQEEVEVYEEEENDES